MSPPESAGAERKNSSLLIRGAIWIAIGALIAAALVCVVWVLIGDQKGLIGRAFLTILLLAAFAGIAILEASLAPNRPDWLALASMISWIIALLVGLVKIWLPGDTAYFGGAERFFQLLLVIGVLQLALLHVRRYTAAAQRHQTTFTRVIYLATLVFIGALVGMLVFALTFPRVFHYEELYWRIVVALTILVFVGTALIPLLNALFVPRQAPSVAPLAWPTYADARTPLPALPDGTPDWNAYYTGYPTAFPAPPAVQPLAAGAPFPSPSSPLSPPVESEAPVAPGSPPAPAAPSSPAAAPAPAAALPGEQREYPPPPPVPPTAPHPPQ